MSFVFSRRDRECEFFEQRKARGSESGKVKETLLLQSRFASTSIDRASLREVMLPPPPALNRGQSRLSSCKGLVLALFLLSAATARTGEARYSKEHSRNISTAFFDRWSDTHLRPRETSFFFHHDSSSSSSDASPDGPLPALRPPPLRVGRLLPSAARLQGLHGGGRSGLGLCRRRPGTEGARFLFFSFFLVRFFSVLSVNNFDPAARHWRPHARQDPRRRHPPVPRRVEFLRRADARARKGSRDF